MKGRARMTNDLKTDYAGNTANNSRPETFGSHMINWSRISTSDGLVVQPVYFHNDIMKDSSLNQAMAQWPFVCGIPGAINTGHKQL